MARFSLSEEETAMTSDASEAQALADAADAAGKGPSIQHTQPWRWCRTGDELDLYVDYRHGLEVTDVEARLAVLSCGTALHRAVVKALHHYQTIGRPHTNRRPQRRHRT
jgi:hypothetical protein